MTISQAQIEQPSSFDVVVVGAGFAGMYTLYKLRALGMSACVFEAASDVGGTWYWNRYPGARCDVESMQYSYSFSKELQEEWSWTERYATQPEILKYAQHVAQQFDLKRDIRFETSVVSATFVDAENLWQIATNKGYSVTARFCIMATGCLSTPRKPHIAGVNTFAGQWYHTAQWPHEGVNFTGKRVGVIGTGSTSIQLIPQLAKQAKHLTVFQRTANYSLPARNHLLTPKEEDEIKRRYDQLRNQMRLSPTGTLMVSGNISALSVSEQERNQTYERLWQIGGLGLIQHYNDIAIDMQANGTLANFVRDKIRQTVKDPATAESLVPKDHPIGTKRICIDIDYFETYNRDNVTLVDLKKDPIIEITPTGVRTKSSFVELDCLVFATGFDAMTGALLAMDIRGRYGQTLKEKWAAGPRTYLGVQTAGFPNLFMITGPGSPSVLSNMMTSIEQHVDWITDCLAYMRKAGLTTIEPLEEDENNWVDHVNDLANKTLYNHANSWYLGANIPGKPRVFMPYVGGVGAYREHCEQIAHTGYPGFKLARS